MSAFLSSPLSFYGVQVCIETFEASPQLGRFTLRDEGKTIGIGKCLELMSDDAA